ncbi:MAG: GNAT family N-acetyltransferase [Myxococcota bacterium]
MELHTERLVLRELRETDWEDALAVDGDPEVVRFQSYDALTPELARRNVAKSIAAAAATPRVLFELAVTRRGEDRYLGRVGVHVTRPEHREGTVWASLHRAEWHHGYAREAGRAVLTFAFEELKLHRLAADCDPRNVASARLMEQLGFRREGTLRQNWWLKGEWCDSALFGLLAAEWASSFGQAKDPER